MHVRIRMMGKPDCIVVVESKLTKIEHFRRIIKEKFEVNTKLQRLFYGGKLLEDGYTFHDYNIKLNDVIQLMVKVQTESSNHSKTKDEPKKTEEKADSDKEKVYKDASSSMYAVGDLIDMKDKEQGAWFEGKISRICQDIRKTGDRTSSTETNGSNVNNNENLDESDTENVPPSKSSPKAVKKGIAKYFSPKSSKKQTDDEIKSKGDEHTEVLFEIHLDEDESEDTKTYCSIKEIRPRARTAIEIDDVKIGQTYMVNYNTEDTLEKGYWYDFTVNEIKKLRTSHELVGTLYLGPDAVPQHDTRVRVHDKIFVIETPVPLDQRTEEYNKLMAREPEKRSSPLNCLTCRDDEDSPCKDCGCYLCSGKENPEKIVLCDECNKGYHMKCLTPPLSELPEEDWYCPSCKRDPNNVIAPGAGKQTKKASVSKGSRDWGRGMACVGKTKTCAMPPNHFGPIPGIEVGMCWRFRIQLSESGVHRPPVSGIHGRDTEGAYSIVLSGGYEDDVDNGIEFTYTGSGGRDLSGNKRTAEQSCDQTLTRENKALARNCAVKEVSESGGDAGDKWRDGKPVRVVRSYKMMKHFPKYAPKEGIRYDGIYKIVKYYPEKGLSGYRVWKYLLRRDDTCPAPWEEGAKQYPIVYPDGYLEAEAEKKAQKEKKVKKGKNVKKRTLRESNDTPESDNETASPPGKKRKTETKKSPKSVNKDRSKSKTPNKAKSTIADLFSKGGKTKKAKEEAREDLILSAEEKEAIDADALNCKLWAECVEVCNNQGKKEFVEHVTQAFLCIICQEVAVNPVTTSCLHNFCVACLKLAFKSTGAQTCPCCRQNLAKFEVEPNEKLKAALRSIMPGYDAGKK